MTRRVYIHGWYLLALLILCGSMMPARAAVPPSRTLPSYIQRIYVREFKNNSRQFGLQADLTLHVNDEFILDGRLDVVESERSDVRLEGKIKSFRALPSGFGGDEFPLITNVELICVVELWDPYDSDRLVPLARYTVPTAIQYISDPRRTLAETDTEAQDRLLRQAARNIVQTVLMGVPDPQRPIDDASQKRYQERSGSGKFEPVMTHPRFPKPTPVAGRTRRMHSDD